jgi:hypothetical protein
MKYLLDTNYNQGCIFLTINLSSWYKNYLSKSVIDLNTWGPLLNLW